jgi:hypothetical protein
LTLIFLNRGRLFFSFIILYFSCFGFGMGSGPIALTGSSGSGWRGWWWWCRGQRCSGNNNSKHNNSVNISTNGSNNDSCVLSWSFGYFLFSFVLLGWIASLYARFLLTPNVRASLTTLGCREDNEGSWSIGVFYGDSPFTLKPIEQVGFSFYLSVSEIN